MWPCKRKKEVLVGELTLPIEQLTELAAEVMTDVHGKIYTLHSRRQAVHFLSTWIILGRTNRVFTDLFETIALDDRDELNRKTATAVYVRCCEELRDVECGDGASILTLHGG